MDPDGVPQVSERRQAAVLASQAKRKLDRAPAATLARRAGARGKNLADTHARDIQLSLQTFAQLGGNCPWLHVKYLLDHFEDVPVPMQQTLSQHGLDIQQGSGNHIFELLAANADRLPEDRRGPVRARVPEAFLAHVESSLDGHRGFFRR